MSNLTALFLIDHLTSSRFALAQFYAAITLPAFVIGIFAGSIVDVTDKRKLMLITDFLLAILFASYALFTNNYWAILIIAFASSAVSQFFTPAEAATIPQIVKGKELNSANALFLFTGLGSVVLGYALAGPVIDFVDGNLGFQTAFVLSGILTGIGFFLRLSLRTIDPYLDSFTHKKLFAKTIAMTREVVEITKKDPKIYLPMLLLTLVQFNIGVLSILFIDYVKTYLYLKTTATSLILVLPLAIGLAIGTLFLKFIDHKLGSKRGVVINLGAFLFGGIILILGIAALVFFELKFGVFFLRFFTALTSFIVGICAVLISVHSRTILQEHTPQHMLGRVFAFVTVAASIVTPIPILLLTLLTEKLDVATIFVFFGVLLLAISFIIKPVLVNKIS